MEHEPHHIVQNVPLTQEEDKDDYSYDGEFEEVDKRSFIHKTFNKIFSTKSTTKIDKISKVIELVHSSQ